MGDADRGVRGVDVLSSGPRGAEGLDAEIRVIDVDLDVVVDVWVDTGRAVWRRALESRRDPDQAVNPDPDLR